MQMHRTAIDNNYDVKYYTKKAGNLDSQDLIESNQATLANAKDTAVRSLKTQYNTVLTTRDALNAAKAQLQVAEANLNIAQANLAVGSQTSLQYQSTLNTYTAAKNDVNTKQLQLLLALEAYDWNVKRPYYFKLKNAFPEYSRRIRHKTIPGVHKERTKK